MYYVPDGTEVGFLFTRDLVNMNVKNVEIDFCL